MENNDFFSVFFDSLDDYRDISRKLANMNSIKKINNNVSICGHCKHWNNTTQICNKFNLKTNIYDSCTLSDKEPISTKKDNTTKQDKYLTRDEYEFLQMTKALGCETISYSINLDLGIALEIFTFEGEDEFKYRCCMSCCGDKYKWLQRFFENDINLEVKIDDLLSLEVVDEK